MLCKELLYFTVRGFTLSGEEFFHIQCRDVHLLRRPGATIVVPVNTWPRRCYVRIGHIEHHLGEQLFAENLKQQVFLNGFVPVDQAVANLEISLFGQLLDFLGRASHLDIHLLLLPLRILNHPRDELFDQFFICAQSQSGSLLTQDLAENQVVGVAGRHSSGAEESAIQTGDPRDERVCHGATFIQLLQHVIVNGAERSADQAVVGDQGHNDAQSTAEGRSANTPRQPFPLFDARDSENCTTSQQSEKPELL